MFKVYVGINYKKYDKPSHIECSPQSVEDLKKVLDDLITAEKDSAISYVITIVNNANWSVA